MVAPPKRVWYVVVCPQCRKTYGLDGADHAHAASFANHHNNTQGAPDRHTAYVRAAKATEFVQEEDDGHQG